MDEKQTPVDESRKNTLLFAQLIEILTQNAVMMLGGMPDRQGRSRPPDLNAAEMMIDMLGVLQKKTKGNLSQEEERMISGTLFQLQTAFAEVASKSGDFEKARKATESMEAADEEEELGEEMGEPIQQQQPPPRQPQAASSSAPQPAQKGIQPSALSSADRENKIKFTKKYS
jgi:hypothetical protein